jgi:hypothetical protein
MYFNREKILFVGDFRQFKKISQGDNYVLSMKQVLVEIRIKIIE